MRTEQIGHREPISSMGLARTLEGMVQRLAGHQDRYIAYYADGQVVQKTFPEVLADVEQARRKLESYGLRRGMRVGIFASNSYAWMVHDLALILLGVTTLPFPDETPAAELPGKFERYRLSLLLASSDLLPAYPMKQPVAFLDGSASGPVTIRAAEPLAADGPFIPSIVFSSGSSGRLKALQTDGPGSLEVIEQFCAFHRLYRDDLFYVFLPMHSYQTRIMIYGCINYGINLALAKTNELLQGLKDFRPTVSLSPPLLFDSVKKQFEEALRGQPAPRRALFHAARSFARVTPSGMRERLLGVCYGRLRETFGGRMRMMWTGMAPVRPATLEFFAEAGLPVLEAYGLTECGPIASNSLEENRVGSVGKPLVPGSVRLAEDGEVLVEREAMFTTGYFEADPADEAATYLRPGLVATGDVGAFDEDGFLYLKGRKKEMIITSGGHKVHPEIIEGHLERSPLVLQAVVFGQGLPHLAAVIVVRRPEEDRRAVEAWVAEVQREIPYDVRIERLHLTAEELSTANGLLTENLKVNRKAILQRYRDHLAEPQARTFAA